MGCHARVGFTPHREPGGAGVGAAGVPHGGDNEGGEWIVVRARNGEEMGPRPVEKTSGTDHGEPEQARADRQLRKMEYKAHAAVDLLRTKRLLSTIGAYEVCTTLTIGHVVRYRCSVRRQGTEWGSGFSPIVVDRTPELGPGTALSDTTRVALALEAVEVHFGKCADIRARATPAQRRPSQPRLVAAAVLT